MRSEKKRSEGYRMNVNVNGLRVFWVGREGRGFGRGPLLGLVISFGSLFCTTHVRETGFVLRSTVGVIIMLTVISYIIINDKL